MMQYIYAFLNQKKFPKSRQIQIKIITFSIICFIFLLRGMNIIANPQLFAEDGSVFFEDTYNHGAIKSLFMSYSGYYLFISRIIASFSSLFRFEYTPFVYTLLSLLISVVVCSFFLIDQFEWFIPDIYHRAIVCLMLAALPANHEVFLHLLNIQWYLGIFSFLMTLVAIPNRIFWRIIYTLVWVILIFSVPQAFIFIPCLFVFAFIRRENKITTGLVGVLLSFSVIFISFSTTQSINTTIPEPSFSTVGFLKAFINIIILKVIAASFVGSHNITQMILTESTYYAYFWLIPVLALIAVSISVFFRSRKYNYLLFLVYAIYTICTSIGIVLLGRRSVMVDAQHLDIGMFGNERYYILSIAVTYIILVWITGVMAYEKQFWPLMLSLGLLLSSTHAIYRDFFIKTEPDMMWTLHTQRLQQTEAVGVTSPLFIPINPISTKPWGTILLPKGIKTDILQYPSLNNATGNFDKAKVYQIIADMHAPAAQRVHLDGWVLNPGYSLLSSDIIIIEKSTRKIVIRLFLNTAFISYETTLDGTPVQRVDWSVDFPAQQLGSGTHTLQAMLFDSITNQFYRIPGEQIVIIPVHE